MSGLSSLIRSHSDLGRATIELRHYTIRVNYVQQITLNVKLSAKYFRRAEWKCANIKYYPVYLEVYMSEPTFHPKVEQSVGDNVPRQLRTTAEYILVFVYGLLPILFLPIHSFPVSLTKFFVVVIAVSLAVLLFCLSVLREGRLEFRIPLGIVALFLVVIASGVTAFFSGDLLDGFFGNDLGQYTVASVLLLAVVTVSLGILSQSRQAVIRLYQMLFISAFILGSYHIIRILFGPDWLSFGFDWLESPTASPFSGWNGLAIFFGLVAILCVMALDQLPLTRPGHYAVVLVGVLSIAVLALVNFIPVWFVLVLASAAALIYLVLKHRLANSEHFDEKGLGQFLAILLTLGVLIVSLSIIIGGPRLSGAIANFTGTSYVEVRPSFTATLDIARGVFLEEPWFGVGPNKFSEAWQTYKDPNINNTVFWDSRFESGYSYLLTSFVNTGAVGTVAWAIFFLTLLFSGFRMLRFLDRADRFWRFIALTSLVSVLYLWGMHAVYIPGRSVLILCAIMTGVFFLAYAAIVPGRSYLLSADSGRKSSILLVALVVVFFAGSVGSAYFVSRLSQSVYIYNKVVASTLGTYSLDSVEANIAEAFDLFPNDTYARQLALYELAEINRLLLVDAPAEADKTQFESAVGKSLNAVRLATQIDPTEHLNWQVLGQIYGALSLVGIEGSYEEAKRAYSLSKQYNPKHPGVYLLEAQLELSVNKLSEARALANQALEMKSDYADAMYFLAQVDLAEGKVAEALSRMQNVVASNPQNPIAYYQLGVLLASEQRSEEAIAAFEHAVSLDEQYSNARYFLALGYIDQGRIKEAVAQLSRVRELNPENAAILRLIEQLESGARPEASEREADIKNSTDQPIEDQVNTVDAPADIDSDLITTDNAIVEQSGAPVETATTSATQ